MAQGKAGPQYIEITKPAILVGRNNTPVPPDEVEMMAKIGCTDQEIADHYGVTQQALKRNLVDYLIKGRSEMKQTLRKAQLRVALEGNATMLIWLGKNLLGQSDSPQSTAKEILPWQDDDDESTAIDDDFETEEVYDQPT